MNQNAADNSAAYQMFKAENFNKTLSGVLGAGGQAFGSSYGGSSSAPTSFDGSAMGAQSLAMLQSGFNGGGF